MILFGDTLYGTTFTGGNSGNGTVFTLKTNGTGFTNLHTFTSFFSYINGDGANPHASLLLSGDTLYGTAQNGGALGSGTVFKLNTNGNGFAVLYTFTARSASNYTNSDGAYPWAGLILSGNTLYGTTGGGGFTNYGVLFRVNIDGTAFTNLYNFGSAPAGTLILSSNTFFGTASDGGLGYGAVFKINTNGTGFTNIYKFTVPNNNASSVRTNIDGVFPIGGLILSSNTLYGTTASGGREGGGTVFALNSNGKAFTNLHSFVHSSTDGANPYAGLILSGNNLYGTTIGGGLSPNYGTVFSLPLPQPPQPPQLTIIYSGSSIILTWPTNYAGFTLQSTTNLFSPVLWNTVSPGPVIVNQQYAVLSIPSLPQQFYRLIK